MLFIIKNKALPSLILAAVLAAAGLALIKALGLGIDAGFYPGILREIIIGLAAILASDMLMTLLLVRVFSAYFIKSYGSFIAYFEGQSAPAVIAGGVLAGAEEIIFRGVILNGLVSIAGLDVPAAVIISALLFGAAHIRPKNPDIIFSLWAVWEGVMLGAVYVYSGSLLTVAIVHAAHDIIGFSVFALQRKRGIFIFTPRP